MSTYFILVPLLDSGGAVVSKISHDSCPGGTLGLDRDLLQNSHALRIYAQEVTEDFLEEVMLEQL